MNSKLRILVSAKELRDKRNLGIRTIAEETGASVSTVQRLMNNSMRRVPLDDLARLCRYFECAVGDILVFDPNEFDGFPHELLREESEQQP